MCTAYCYTCTRTYSSAWLACRRGAACCCASHVAASCACTQPHPGTASIRRTVWCQSSCLFLLHCHFGEWRATAAWDMAGCVPPALAASLLNNCCTRGASSCELLTPSVQLVVTRERALIVSPAPGAWDRLGQGVFSCGVPTSSSWCCMWRACCCSAWT